jgi:hypothetical protein
VIEDAAGWRESPFFSDSYQWAASAAAGGDSSVLVEEASRASTPPRNTTTPRARCDDADVEAFELVVTEGESPGRRIAIGPAPLVIGRGIGVDLEIRDPTVSRHHCVIWSIQGRCWVRDLGSKNQTRVNNRLSLVTEIFAGDVLVVGETAMKLTRTRPKGNGNDSARPRDWPRLRTLRCLQREPGWRNR